MVQILLLVALLHHSFGAEYDVNQPITLTGTLTGIEWTNPHTHFYLDVKDSKGAVVNWKFEVINNGSDATCRVAAIEFRQVLQCLCAVSPVAAASRQRRSNARRFKRR